MFIPLHDRNALKHIRRQYVTLGLIAANVISYALASVVPDAAYELGVYGLGFIPAILLGGATLDPSLVLVPDWATYVTYAFLHGSWLHLGSNMLFLWVFGDNVEDAMGHLRFLLFYLACAAAGALVHGLVMPVSQAPLIGASGAVSVSLRPMSCCIRRSGSGFWFSCAFHCRCRPSSRSSSGSVSNS